METVEVLVRIPKKDFEELQSNYVWWGRYGEYIKNGTILPKGHGRLIDEKVAYRKFYARCLAGAATEVFAETPTIIEATKEE